MGGGSVPILDIISTPVTATVKKTGQVITTTVVKAVDLSKDFSSYPNVEDYNNLKLQLESGVIPEAVNTVIIRDDVSTVNDTFDSVMENMPDPSTDNIE